MTLTLAPARVESRVDGSADRARFTAGGLFVRAKVKTLGDETHYENLGPLPLGWAPFISALAAAAHRHAEFAFTDTIDARKRHPYHAERVAAGFGGERWCRLCRAEGWVS